MEEVSFGSACKLQYSNQIHKNILVTHMQTTGSNDTLNTYNLDITYLENEFLPEGTDTLCTGFAAGHIDDYHDYIVTYVQRVEADETGQKQAC